MKYVATRLEKKIVSYIHLFEDFPIDSKKHSGLCWIIW